MVCKLRQTCTTKRENLKLKGLSSFGVCTFTLNLFIITGLQERGGGRELLTFLDRSTLLETLLKLGQWLKFPEIQNSRTP